MSKTVLTDYQDSVCTLTLHRPERLNAMNDQMLRELKSALDEAHEDDDIGAVLLKGSGRAFCSGDDLKDFDKQSRSEQDSLEFIESIQDITRSIVFGNKIVIGAIHGWAVGGGLEWAINCDLAVFAEDTRCFFPEIKWGMFPTGGVTAILPRVVGLVKTKELMLLGTEFNAQEALEMGLAWKVVANEDLFAVAHDVAAEIARLPRSAVTNLKQVLNDIGAVNIERAINMETEATVRGFLDSSTQERVRNFGR